MSKTQPSGFKMNMMCVSPTVALLMRFFCGLVYLGFPTGPDTNNLKIVINRSVTGSLPVTVEQGVS